MSAGQPGDAHGSAEGVGSADGDRPAFDPRHDAIYQRGYRPGDNRPSNQAPADSYPAEPADEADALLAEVLTVEPEPSSRNPFIGVLWVLGVFFFAAGVLLQYIAVGRINANYSFSGNGPLPLELVIQQMSYSVSPPLMIAGLLIVAGLLFWHATTWRARRNPHQ